VSRQQQDIGRANRPVDPKYIAGWQRFCAENPQKGGCEVILERLGTKPVIGVLFAPDSGGGVRIARVTPDGAGAAAGLKSGGRLLRIGGKTIEGASPHSRVENARRMLHKISANTAVELRYGRGDLETDVEVKPRLDSRIMVFAGDGTMMRPGGNVIVHRLDNGVIDIDTDPMDIETLRNDAPLNDADAPRVFVFSDHHLQEDDAGQPRVEKPLSASTAKVIRKHVASRRSNTCGCDRQSIPAARRACRPMFSASTANPAGPAWARSAWPTPSAGMG
jgi:hypothetical protein